MPQQIKILLALVVLSFGMQSCTSIAVSKIDETDSSRKPAQELNASQSKIYNGALRGDIFTTGNCPDKKRTEIENALDKVVLLTFERNKRFCSGVIINLPNNPDLNGRLVLTAAHCVHAMRKRFEPVKGIQVHRESVTENSTSRGVDVVAAYVLPEAYSEISSSRYFLSLSPGDYAVLETSEPIGESQITTSNENILNFDRGVYTFLNAGFGADIDANNQAILDSPLKGFCMTSQHSINGIGVQSSAMSTLATNIQAEQTRGNRLLSNSIAHPIRLVVPVDNDDYLTNGTICKGDSGSPLFAIKKNEIAIVGITSGTENVPNFSTPIPVSRDRTPCGTGTAFATPPAPDIDLSTLQKLDFPIFENP